MMAKENKWWEDQNELVEFAKVLYEAGSITEAGHVINYMEKPWKWQYEHRLWKSFGKPSLDDEEFNNFLRELYGRSQKRLKEEVT